jgi:cytochrome c oxidase subunit 2
MRIIFSLLLALVPILGVYTFVTAPDHGWWFPQNVSTYGGDIDGLFNLIMWMVCITFVGTEVLLFWFVFKYSKKDPSKATFSHGNHKLEMIWTAVPAVLLLFIAFAQMGTWADIKFGSHFPEGTYSIEKPIAEVLASQFDWRVRYPGADGEFGTMDDIENPFEFVVPANENVVFHLRSRDVIHSFFVPEFRLKQDALPGHTIPVWFNATKEGTYDLICAELCGWGHYKMAGRVRVLPRPDYEAWMEEATQAWFTNGMDEVQGMEDTQ